jgi:phosphatidylglycerophosphate synthase
VINSIYTYIRILIAALPFAFLFFIEESIIGYLFFVAVVIFSISIPLKRLLKEGSLTEFESKLNYFLDEFFVYGAVILLGQHSMAPLWVVIIYFFKDATIGAMRNFAIKNDVELNERFGYKIDKVVQYSVILAAAFSFISYSLYPVSCWEPRLKASATLFAKAACVIFSVGSIHTMFYVSAAVSALTLIVFFFLNKGFMKKIHNS